MLIRYLGPAKEITFDRGLRKVTFVAGGEAVDVEDDFADELLGKNPEGFTVEQAAGYGVPVFEQVGATPSATVTFSVPPVEEADDQ